MKKSPTLISTLAMSLLACQICSAMEVKEDQYGAMPDGKKVKVFTLTNKNGLTAKVIE